jgi:type IV secretory pathway TraG/TraD family ATPase VirD4
MEGYAWLQWHEWTPIAIVAAALVAVLGGRAWSRSGPGCARRMRRSPAGFRYPRASDPGLHARGSLVIDRLPRGWRTVQSPRRCARLGRWSDRSSSPLTLGGIEIPVNDEPKHFKLIGTTGTGKSTAIRELLEGAFARGDRAIVTDPDGAYRARFHSRYRGDVVLNPFEPASAKWDVFAEVQSAYDVEQLASALIPSSEDASASEWRGYARTLLGAILRRCHRGPERDPGELWRLLAVAGSGELRPIVAGTPAQPFLDPDNARMFGSIRSVAVSAAAALEHVVAQRTRAISVREWVRSGSGVLFIPYRAGQVAALRSIIAAWMRLAIIETMNRAEGAPPLWFVIDELDALGAIDGLKDALARLRKFGGRCVLGFQSIAQVSSTYGAGEAQTIVENCASTLILRCSGSEHGGTSQFASRLIGEREVLRRQVSRGRDRESIWTMRGSRRSTSISEQRMIEPAVMPSELEQLADLHGYLKLPSSPAWMRIALTP